MPAPVKHGELAKRARRQTEAPSVFQSEIDEIWNKWFVFDVIISKVGESRLLGASNPARASA
jgi:hypothetical protein